MIEEIRPEQSKEWSSFLGRHSLMADLRIPIFLAVDMTQQFSLVMHTYILHDPVFYHLKLS